jgi:hypothetical protein
MIDNIKTEEQAKTRCSWRPSICRLGLSFAPFNLNSLFTILINLHSISTRVFLSYGITGVNDPSLIKQRTLMPTPERQVKGGECTDKVQ